MESPHLVVLLKASARYERALQARGFATCCAPILEFTPVNTSMLETVRAAPVAARCDRWFCSDTPAHARSFCSPAQHVARPGSFGGLVLTSPRAVDVLAASIAAALITNSAVVDWYRLPCYVVGARSAHCAESAGFVDVRGAEAGRAAALASKIIADRSVLARGSTASAHAALPLLFPCGEQRRDELPTKLTEGGVPFVELAVYTSAVRDAVPPPARLLSWRATIRAAAPPPTQPALLWLVAFSPRGVAAATQLCVPWLREVAEALGDCCELRFGAIGPTTARAMAATSWGVNVTVAQSPSPDALADALLGALP